MKHSKKIISALVAVMSLGMSSIPALGMSSIPVCADSNTAATSNTTAATSNTATGKDKTNTGVAVTSGQLSIDSVPASLDFSDTVDDIANSRQGSSADLKTTDNVQTTDDLGYGANTHWTLTATPSQLSYTDSNGTSHDLKVKSLTLHDAPINAIDGTTATPVATDSTEGTMFTPITPSNSVMMLFRNQQVYAKNYTGTIVWTLTDSGNATSSAAQ